MDRTIKIGLNIIKAVKITKLFVLATLLVGCAEFTHLTRTRDLSYETIVTSSGTSSSQSNDRTAVFIDAKQRAVISSMERLCAEPSPDAISALAASFGLSVTAQEAAQLNQSLAISEGASSIGLRTQSIQLMRDSMYRLCEGYLSGSLTKPAYQDMFRRFQLSMVSILAIEQLTGVQKAPTVALTGSAVVGSAELASKYTDLTEQSKTKVSEAEEAAKTAKGELDTANEELATAIEDNGNLAALEQEKASLEGDDKVKDPGEAPSQDDAAAYEKYKSDKAAYDEYQKEVTENASKIAKVTAASEKQLLASKKHTDAEATLANRRSELEANDRARLAAISSSGETSMSVQIASPTTANMSDESVESIAETVREIVLETVNQDVAEAMCVSILQNLTWDTEINPRTIAWYCLVDLFNQEQLLSEGLRETGIRPGSFPSVIPFRFDLNDATNLGNNGDSAVGVESIRVQ